MTEVPNAIMWIAASALIVQTVLFTILLVVLIVLVSRVKQLVDKLKEAAEPLKEAADSVGTTVTTFNNSLLRSLATAVGVLAGFNKGSRGRRRK